MFLLRASILSKRVLLLDIATPVPMSDMFVPSLSGIDWSLGDIVIPKGTVLWGIGDIEGGSFALVESGIAASLNEQFLVIEGEHVSHGPSVAGSSVGGQVHLSIRLSVSWLVQWLGSTIRTCMFTDCFTNLFLSE